MYFRTIFELFQIELVAGQMIGIIIKISEKIANKSVFGGSDSEVSDLSTKLSLIPGKKIFNNV